MAAVVPIAKGRGLKFGDWVKKTSFDGDNVNMEFEFQDVAMKPGTLFLVGQDNGIIFAGIQYEGNNSVFVCGRFQVCIGNEWHDIDLTDIPHSPDEFMERFDFSTNTLKLKTIERK